jgi:hypothetical protein
MKPVQERLSAYEKQQEQNRFRKIQEAKAERSKIFQDFTKEHPDFTEVEPLMMEEIQMIPDFFNLPPKNFGKLLKRIYTGVTASKREAAAKEKGIKQMLKQNEKAQKAASRSSSTPSGKTFKDKGKGLSFDECSDLAWEETMGG